MWQTEHVMDSNQENTAVDSLSLCKVKVSFKYSMENYVHQG